MQQEQQPPKLVVNQEVINAIGEQAALVSASTFSALIGAVRMSGEHGQAVLGGMNLSALPMQLQVDATPDVHEEVFTPELPEDFKNVN